jgi:ATP-dependent Clp protease ATP-binding subunit ClpA
MFERFTDRARRVVVLAQEDARLLNHNYIGTEHLLLGLIHEGRGVAAQALESLGISLEEVRQQVEHMIGRGQQPPRGHVPFTPRAKKVLELAMRESDALGHVHIDTEHLLLGLIREGHGVGVQVLAKLTGDASKVRQQVIRLLPRQAGTGAIGAGRRLGKGERQRLIDDALARIGYVDQRLAAVERWVGLAPDLDDLDQEMVHVRREKESAIESQDFEGAAALRDKEKELFDRRMYRAQEWSGAAEGRPSLAAALGRMNAELERLRAILREHGIEPGDGAG